jgi:hypothetical protein
VAEMRVMVKPRRQRKQHGKLVSFKVASQAMQKQQSGPGISSIIPAFLSDIEAFASTSISG